MKPRLTLPRTRVGRMAAGLLFLVMLFSAGQAVLGFWQLASFQLSEPERYERVFGGDGYSPYGSAETGSDPERSAHARQVKEDWGEEIESTLARYWGHIDLGLAPLISLLLVAAFYALRGRLLGEPGNRFPASGLYGLLAAIAAGAVLVSIGYVWVAVNSVGVRGLVPHWADSLVIPMMQARSMAPINIGILLALGFLLSLWGRPAPSLFPPVSGRSIPRLVVDEIAGLPFIVLAVLLAFTAPELAMTVPFFLHAGLSLRARAIARGNPLS